MTTESQPDETPEGIPVGRECEVQLREQNEQLRQANRRQDRFLDIVLHELRNPIAAISMAAEALSQFAAKTADVQAMSDVIARQSLHASRLLDELLEVSRITKGKLELRKERLNLVDCLRAVIAGRGTGFDEQRAQVRLELPPTTLWVEADPGRISQALGKLIEGAVKLMRPGDQLFIKVSSSADQKLAVVEVRELSVDMAPEALATIFEPFHHGEASRQGGLAIGLPLAKGLVELHGGRIEAESGPGQGTCFRMTLPVADVAANEAGPVGAAVTQQRPLRVLVIDDNSDVVTSLEFLLAASGHLLNVAATGKQGIEAARRLRPDVVLCDIGLPDMEGYAVARQLRGSPDTAAVYLVAVSGFASDEDRHRSLAAGFDLHLNKPEGFVGLNERLQSLPIGRQ
ncbi:MAG: hybrid sensor histidine kinase/response regulator [Pirellulales bacterium]